MLKKLLVCMLALMMTLSLMLTGCAGKEKETVKEKTAVEQKDDKDKKDNKEEAEEPTLEPVELTYYFAHSPTDSLKRMNDLVNETVKEKINATIEYKLLDWSQFPQKMNLMISSGEPFDMAFSASWGENNYFQNAANGAFLPLDDLMDKYAPVSKSRVPEQIWNGVKVNGNIYGVINYQVWGMSNALGVQLRQDLVDELGFDWKSVEKWDDLTPYLQKVKENYPEMIPFEYLGNYDNFAQMPAMYGMDAVGDNSVVGWVKYDDTDVTVYNQYKTEEYKNYLKTFRNWYQKGYIKSDAATITDAAPDRQADRVASLYAQTLPDMVDYPAQSSITKMSMSESKLSYTKRFTEPYVSGSAPSATVTVIGANSANPERSMMYIELVNTDDDLFNTIAYGVEGTDYERVTDKIIKVDSETPHQWFPEWEMGQSFGRYWWSDLSGITNEEELAMRENQLKIKYDHDAKAMASPVLGFVFDVEPVKTEIANCNTVLDKYLAALGSGTVDPDKELSNFLNGLDKAGAEKIIAEKQRQINEWLRANGR